MIKILELAIAKASKLPPAAQEQLGRELIERIDTLEGLRSAIEAGVKELDAGLGQSLDVEDLINKAHAGHGRNE